MNRSVAVRVCLWWMVISSVLVPAVFAATSDELFNSAVTAFVGGKYEESLLYLNQVLLQNPNHERAKKLVDNVKEELRAAGKPIPQTPPATAATVTEAVPAATLPVSIPAASPAAATLPVVAPAPAPQPAPAPTPAPKAVIMDDLIVDAPAAKPAAPPAETPKESAFLAPAKEMENKPADTKPPASPDEPVLRFGPEKAPAGEEASVYGIEVYGGTDAPLVFIKTTEGVDFLHNPVTSPPMMSIDFPGAMDRLPKKTFELKRGPILRIRHSQHLMFPIPTARVTIDLRKGSEQPDVEAGRGGIWVRFGGALPPKALAGAPIGPAGGVGDAGETAAPPPVEIGPPYAFTEPIGSGQLAPVMKQAKPIGVKVADGASGQPVIDLPVTFEITDGVGSLSTSLAADVKKLTVKSDKSGVAEVPLFVGKKLETIYVKVTAGDPAKFNEIVMSIPVVVTAGAPIHIEKVSGDGQEAITGEELKDPLAVRITDEFGNPAVGAKAQYSILKGNGRLDTIKFNDPRDNEAIADTAGVAKCEVWVLGIEPGEQSVEARLLGVAGAGERVLFTAKAGQRIVSLDFKDAVVIDVIRTLAQLGNMNVIFDLEYDEGRKKFVVPFIDPKGNEKKNEIPPLTIHVVDVSVLEALDMVLESSGLTRVSEGNTVRIIAKTRALGRPLPVTNDTPVSGGKFVTHVFPLKYTIAENMQKLLTEFVERDGGQIIADPLSNQLLVVQTADNVKKVSDVLDLLDIPTSKSRETNLEVRSFTLKNVPASDMAMRLADFLKDPGQFEFTVINSDLSISRLGTLKYNELTLTRSTKAGKDNVREEFIKQTLLMNIIAVNPASNTLTILSTREVLTLVGQVLESLDVRTEFSDTGIQEFRFNYLDTEQAKALIERYISPSGKYTLYTDFHGALIHDNRHVLQEIESAINSLDKGAKKLLIYRLKFINPTNLQQLLSNFFPTPPQQPTAQKSVISFSQGSFIQQTISPATQGRQLSQSWWTLDLDNRMLVFYDAPGIIESALNFLRQADAPDAYIRNIKLNYLKPARVTQILRDMLNINVTREFQKTFPYFFEELASKATIASTAGKGAGKINLTELNMVYPMESTGAILVIADPGLISTIESVVAQIDVPVPAGMEFEYIDVTNLASSFLAIGDREYTPTNAAFGNVKEKNRFALLGEPEELIKNTLSPSGTFFVTPVAGRFYLLVNDKPEKIADLKILLQKLSKMPELEYRLYTMKYARIADVQPALLAFITPDDRGGEGAPGRIFALVTQVPATNSLLIAAPKNNYEKIDRLIDKLDITYAPRTQFVAKTYQLKHITVDQAVKLLNSLFATNIAPSTGDFGSLVGRVESIDRNNTVTISTLPPYIPMIDEIVSNIDVESPTPPDMSTEVFYLNNAKPSEMTTILQGMLTQSQVGGQSIGLFAQFAPDDRLNALTVIAPPSVMKIVADLIQKLDRRAPQVLIDAMILEYSLNDLNERGINFITKPKLLRDNSGTVLNPFDADALDGNTGRFGTEFQPPLFGTFGSGGYRVILNTGQVRLLMEALIQSGKVEVLATPKITALNNKKATISAGQTLLVPTTSQTAPGIPLSGLTEVKADLILGVTPTISNDRSVNLQIDLTNDEFDATSSPTRPVINKRSASSSVLLGDNQTLVLGGVIRDRKVTTQTAVPFLKDIPVVGNFFKSKRETTDKTELMIFITPRVITNLPEATQVTKDIAKSLQQITPFPVNINTSSIAEIAELAGLRSDVDPDQHFRLAQRIVSRREQFGPFQALEQLMAVPGLTRIIFDDIVYRIEYKVDPNIVSLQELVKIKGLTLGMAQKIVEDRRARGIFRSEEEFEALMRDLGMNQGFYDRFMKPIIVVQGTNVGDLSMLAPPQIQKLPVEAGRYSVPTPAPAPATQQQPAAPPRTAPAPIVVPTPEPPPKPRSSIAPPPAPGQKTSPMTQQIERAPAPTIVEPIAPAPKPTSTGATPTPPVEPAPVDQSLPPPDIRPSGSPQATPEQQGKIDVNTASLEDLQKLPGIDEYRSKMIDAYRYTYGKFKTISDLKQVPDITDEIFEQIKDKIYISR